MKSTIRNGLIAAAAVAALGGLLVFEVVSTRPVRGAVRAYSELIAVANRPGFSDAERIAMIRPFLSSRLLAAGSIRLAPEGGVEGLPRVIGKNFHAWREGDAIRIRPTGRTGVVHRMIEEDGRWRFDGLVGYQRGDGELVPATETP